MAIIDRNIIDNVVSRGLGNNNIDGIDKDDDGVQLYQIEVNVEANIYEDRYYYPTTGCFSEEEIDGWRWNRTLPQQVSGRDRGNENEITTYVGGYKYNLEEGIPDSHYRGNVINGCNLVDIIQEENKWKPVLSKGSYSVKGRSRNLYSSNSFCKVLGTSSTSVGEIKNFLAEDSFQVAIYRRDENFVKKIFREYKEDNKIYSYTYSNGSIELAEGEELFRVGHFDLTTESDVQAGCEDVGTFKKDSYLYLEYFPVNNIELYVVEDGAVTSVNAANYSLDKELGYIYNIDASLEGKSCYAAYKAVPRLDAELINSGNFIANIDLKSHSWERANGLIELSPEDKHVTRLVLAGSQGAIYYGGGFKSLNCTAFNSKNNVVDEVDITIKCIDYNQEILFEGNLNEFKGVSNSDGKVFTSVNAPLTSESSSYYFKVDPEKRDTYFQFPIPQEEIRQGSFDDSVIFEVLPIDPFYGTEGLTFDVTYVDSRLKVENYQLNKNDYAMFRNLLEIAENYNTTNTGTNNPFVYNTGLLKLADGSHSYSVGIVSIENKDGDVYIEVEKGFNNSLLVNANVITIYKKNSKILKENSNLGVERVLYQLKDDNYELLRPTGYNSIESEGKLVYTQLENREQGNQNDSLVKGYRIYLPRRTKIQASCIDPATGNLISSNVLSYDLVLENIYKSELFLENPNNGNELASKIDTANFISYDPAGNNIYVEYGEK